MSLAPGLRRCAAGLLCTLLVNGWAVAENASTENAAHANVQLGVGYLRQNNLAVAQQVLERALAQNPKDPAVHTALGLLYERLGQSARADTHYGRALRMAPQDPEVLNNYAVFLCRRGEAPRGEKLFLQAAANPLYRTPEVALTNAGVCARAAGRPEPAEQYLRRAIKLKADFADALLPLAELSLEKGNTLSARGFLQRLLAIGPATAETLWLGLRIEQAAGDAAAVQDYQQRLEREFPQFEPVRALRNAAPPGKG